MSTVVVILLALVVLSVLIVVHEFGHYISARLFGVWVEEFGIGYPPKIKGKKIGETEYSINALPVGGFVRLHGETPGMEISKPKRAFLNQSKFARIVISLAGVFMNFLLAICFFTVIFWLTGVGRGVNIVEVVDGSPAHAAGLFAGDKVVSLDGEALVDSQDFPYYLEKHAGNLVNIGVAREVDGERVSVVVPVNVRAEPKKNEGYVGAVYVPETLYEPPVWQRPLVYAKYGLQETYRWTDRIVVGLGTLFKQLLSGTSSGGVAGPLGVTLTFAQAIKYGLVTTLNLAAIISINLALLNLIPFPPLDGSRVVLTLAELVVGTKIIRKHETRVYTVGMIILLLFVAVVTVGEIPKLIHAGSISKFVETILQ